MSHARVMQRHRMHRLIGHSQDPFALRSKSSFHIYMSDTSPRVSKYFLCNRNCNLSVEETHNRNSACAHALPFARRRLECIESMTTCEKMISNNEEHNETRDGVDVNIDTHRMRLPHKRVNPENASERATRTQSTR